METTTTPKTDLEMYQLLRIEALENELAKTKEFLQELMNDLAKHIEVIEHIEL